MNIYLTAGNGSGKTLISAFDAALNDCGVANYNLIPLSSVIPPDSMIIQEKYVTPEEDYGNRLYVVKAEARSAEKGTFVGGAVGWFQLEDGRGVFVEHETTGASQAAVEAELRQLVTDSLTDLCVLRGYHATAEQFGIKLSIAEVGDQPTCALVLAVYQTEPWA